MKKKDRQRNFIPARASFHCAVLLVTTFVLYTICYSIPVRQLTVSTGGQNITMVDSYLFLKCCRANTLMPPAERTSSQCTATSTLVSSDPPRLCLELRQLEENLIA